MLQILKVAQAKRTAKKATEKTAEKAARNVASGMGEKAIDLLEQTILAKICKSFNLFCSNLVEAARAEHTIIGTVAPSDDEVLT